MATDKTADLREQLVALIGAVRSRLDPDTLEAAEGFARAAQAEGQGKVLYDRETAREAVRLFLATKQGDPRFKAKLAEALKRPLPPE